MKLLTRGAGLLAMAIAAAFSQVDPLPDWVLQLSRVKRHLRQNFERMPNYVCRETVDRLVKMPGGTSLRKDDHLEFDVACIGDEESLAAPGRGGFEANAPRWAAPGMFGTGSFSSVPRRLFVADNARITAHRAGPGVTPGGLSYDYEISHLWSGMEISVGIAKAIVGLRGTYWVDAGTMDLIRVEEHAVDVPPSVGMTAARWTVQYARINVGKSNALLPQSAEVATTMLDGTERLNKVEFSACREYVSESKIWFGGDPVPPAAVKKR